MKSMQYLVFQGARWEWNMHNKQKWEKEKTKYKENQVECWVHHSFNRNNHCRDILCISVWKEFVNEVVHNLFTRLWLSVKRYFWFFFVIFKIFDCLQGILCVTSSWILGNLGGFGNILNRPLLGWKLHQELPKLNIIGDSSGV